MQNYNSFKDQVSSEKITLATIEPSKRLIAFINHSGTIYKLNNFNVAVITSVKESGTKLLEVNSISEIIPGSFYNDRQNKVLYLESLNSLNPNSLFLHLTFKLFFASVPVTLPYDLNNGFEVYWEPQILSTSTFGVEIDTIDQQSETIEGSGSLTLVNDQEFWPKNFDKLFFENQNVKIYSWNRELLPTEAKLLFKGKIESKTYKSNRISFKLKDMLAQLRNAVSVPEIQELNLRHSPSLATAKQRSVFGRVFGYKPTNLDSLIDGKYPLTGLASITTTDTTLVGTGTQFLKQLSVDDRILLAGKEYTVASVTDDIHLELTEPYDGDNLINENIQVNPDRPKRWFNRVWCLANHALRKPTTEIMVGSSTGLLFVGSTQDIFKNDYIYVGVEGSGELALVSEVVNSTCLRLGTSLTVNPVPGTVVFRPSVQDLRINDVPLIYARDYTVDSINARLILSENAELNAAPIRESLENATFTNGSRTVTGIDTFFKSYLKSGYAIRPKGSYDWYEILSVDSDISLTLRSVVSGISPNPNDSVIQYKSLIFDDSNDILSCDIIGKTSDATPNGSLLRKSSDIVRQLLYEAGFDSNDLDLSTFVKSLDFAPEDLGFAVPSKQEETSTVTYREVINAVNKSVLGILYQNNDFKLSYDILRPVIPQTPIVIKESDVIEWSCTSTNKNMVSRTIVEYCSREYDYNVDKSSVKTVSKGSDISKFIFDTSREKTFKSLAINQEDAKLLCNRWNFLLEFSTNSIKIQTKLQLINAEINDVIDFEHRKFYERFSGTSKRKFLAIEKIQKNGTGVEIDCVDLSNAFNRICLITDAQTNWSNSNEETRIHSGFITDDFGLIDNDENSFQVNLIW